MRSARGGGGVRDTNHLHSNLRAHLHSHFVTPLLRDERESHAGLSSYLHTAVAPARLPIFPRALTFAPRSRAFVNTRAHIIVALPMRKRFAPKFSERSKRIAFRPLPVSLLIQTRTISLIVRSSSSLPLGERAIRIYGGEGSHMHERKILHEEVRC